MAKCAYCTDEFIGDDTFGSLRTHIQTEHTEQWLAIQDYLNAFDAENGTDTWSDEN